MTKIDSSLVIESEPHVFTAEASMLGLRPGVWPERLETELGNGLPLVRTSKRLGPNGDLLLVNYYQAAGCIKLVVIND